MAWEAGKELSVEDVEVAPPKAHEIRIEIYYTGVCHTGGCRPFSWLLHAVSKQLAEELRGMDC